MSIGQLSHELEVNVSANQAWLLYGTLQLAELVEKELASFIQKIELVEGDGGVGTVLNLIFVPGTSSYKEKFTKVDNEKRIKETEVVEGTYVDLGFTLFRVRFQIIEKENDSCIIKSEIEYQIKEELASNASMVSIQQLVSIAEVAKNYLLKHKGLT